MPIKDLTNSEKLPRLGKIRLGVMAENRNKVKYPRATEYFVVPPEVAEVYGDRPTVIEPVFLPIENEEQFASTFYRYYTQTYGLTCKGDGETAMRIVDMAKLKATGEPEHASAETSKKRSPTSRMEVTCPCPLLDQRVCRPIMCLQVVLPLVKGVGVYQIDTSSYNSIRNVYGCLNLIRQAAGRVTNIPLKLSLIEQEVTPEGQSKKTVRVLSLQVSMDYSPKQLEQYAQDVPPTGYYILPEPDDERPEEISPTPGQMRQADAVEGAQRPQAQTLASRRRPDDMTRQQFSGAMNLNGWTWLWVYADVLDMQPEGDTNIEQAVTEWLDGQGKSWAELYDMCMDAVQPAEPSAPEAEQDPAVQLGLADDEVN